MQFQSLLTSHLGNKTFVFIRLLPAQLVIDMHHRQSDSQFRAQFGQQKQEPTVPLLFYLLGVSCPTVEASGWGRATEPSGCW